MIEVQVSRVFPHKGRPPERKGKLPKGWIPARVSVSGTPHKMRRTVTGSGALSSWTGKEILLP